MRWLTALCLTLALAPVASAVQPTAEAFRLAWQDCQTLPEGDRLHTRYLWFSDREPKLRWRTCVAASGLMNALSKSRRIVPLTLLILQADEGRNGPPGPPTLVVKSFAEMGGPENQDWGNLVLARVLLTHYGQTPAQWDRLSNPDLEPLFHVWTYLPDEKRWVRALAPWLLEPIGVADAKKHQDAAFSLIAATDYAQAPVIEARNFVWQASIDELRPAGYSTWLGVKNQADFEKLVRVDRSVEPLRDAVARSGVAREPRAIERLGIETGVWVTYDQVDKRALGDRNPLLQKDRKKFLFQATEWIGPLQNGMRATGLFSDKGERQDSAPDGVGYHQRSRTNDGKIHNYLTCWSCHDAAAGNAGLHPFTPFFRNKYAEPGPFAAATIRRKDLGLFEEQYLTPIEKWSNIDKLVYAAAVAEATGTTPDVYARSLMGTFNSWDAALDLDAAAHEHGLTVQALTTGLQAALLKYGTLDDVSGNWIDPRAAKIPRNQFAESYNRTQLALRGLTAWPADLKTKLTPWRGR